MGRTACLRNELSSPLLRDVGLWTCSANGSIRIHGGGIRLSVQARFCASLSFHRGNGNRSASRIPFLVKTITYRHETRSIIEDSVYAPIAATVRRLAAKARMLQSGNVQSYLFYILVALLALVLFAK